MKFIPTRTSVLEPPRTDLPTFLDESIRNLEDEDVVIITSKVVAISEGRYVRMDAANKDDLVRAEADYIYERQGRKPLTVVHHALISAAGIDESNGFGHYVLLPKDPFESARRIRTHLMARFSLRELGVVITDSHSLPCRYGAMSVSIGSWGFEPVESHVGRRDLFGRVMRYSSLNIADSIAAASALVSGECDERTPVIIARDVPNLVFSDACPREKLFVPFDEDIYEPLFREFKPTRKRDVRA
ncbi:MAG TPA: coenzyme F420-0:L-glutamate ligase [Candidatus Paceibacterota bacterium]|nr:coenzyme F420-0:L-glutamate ligase [Candidatus Paceibacterota bacterium]